MSLAPGDPMDPNWVPGPYDHYRGTFVFNFQDGLTPEGKARLEAARRKAAAKRAAAAGGTPPPAEAPPSSVPDAPPPPPAAG